MSNEVLANTTRRSFLGTATAVTAVTLTAPPAAEARLLIQSAYVGHPFTAVLDLKRIRRRHVGGRRTAMCLWRHRRGVPTPRVEVGVAPGLGFGHVVTTLEESLEVDHIGPIIGNEPLQGLRVPTTVPSPQENGIVTA